MAPFLQQDESTWPITRNDNSQQLPELKSDNSLCALTSQVAPPNDLHNYMSRYSSLSKLQNVMGYILRFIHNVRHKTNKHIGPLSVSERNHALKMYIKLVQHQHYYKDITLLKRGKECSPALKPLSPFLNEDTLKVGGRLKYASLPDSAKHPYLIPPKSHLAALLCNYYHIYSLHGGPKLVQSLIQRRYWIPGIRNVIRKHIFKCLPCFKLKRQNQHNHTWLTFLRLV